LTHLVAQFLPVVDEISGLFVRHHFGTLIFQDRDHGLGIYSILR